MSALTHVVVGTNDLARARAFYDATLSMLGLRRVRDFDRASIDVGSRKYDFMVATLANGLPAWSNGGTSVSPLRLVKRCATALANGGCDEGSPGPRSFTPTAYAAYVRDPDGNKICAFCFAES